MKETFMRLLRNVTNLLIAFGWIEVCREETKLDDPPNRPEPGSPEEIWWWSH
jgi:hypothetical protein